MAMAQILHLPPPQSPTHQTNTQQAQTRLQTDSPAL